MAKKSLLEEQLLRLAEVKMSLNTLDGHRRFGLSWLRLASRSPMSQ
jgi:hypothetical protein